ncbi:MAG: adenylate kinase [Clostridia bacterium]|nr:adenylate kinase [Clostridia bacterium]
MKLILLGAPGAGKGTQAERISERFQIPTISTGERLRAAMKEGTELGKRAQSYMESGALVPDEVVIGIIKEYLSSDSCKNGFILDGFPRSIPQAEALDAMGVELDAVLSIEVADEKIVERMSGRRVCTECGSTYHVIYTPTKVSGVCDKCGTELTIRKDDAPETVLSRLETYHSITEPLKEFYSEKGLLITVEGQEKLEDTSALVNAALSRFE